MDDDDELDFLDILREVKEERGTEWWARYGKESWLAALVVFGEVSPGITWETLPKYLGGPAPDPATEFHPDMLEGHARRIPEAETEG